VGTDTETDTGGETGAVTGTGAVTVTDTGAVTVTVTVTGVVTVTGGVTGAVTGTVTGSGIGSEMRGGLDCPEDPGPAGGFWAEGFECRGRLPECEECFRRFTGRMGDLRTDALLAASWTPASGREMLDASVTDASTRYADDLPSE
jgi:hypothetical protein